MVHGEAEDLLDGGRVAEGDEAEAARPPRGGVLHDHDLGQLAKVGEVLADGLRGRLPAEAADEHLAGVVGDVAAVRIQAGGEVKRACK